MYFIAILAVVVLISIDQVTKFLTIKYLMPIDSVTIIDGFFRLTYVENRGAAFGILQGAKWLFVVIAVVLIVCGVIYFKKLVKTGGNKLMMTALVMVGAGAVGNIIDRLYYGFVVDMLDFDIFGYNFPVFNFADILVCVGAALMVVCLGFMDKSKC